MLPCCLLAGCEACDVDARDQSILLEAPSWARGAGKALLSSESDAEFTMMMMTFITRRGESQGKTKKERKATKSKGRGLEEGG